MINNISAHKKFKRSFLTTVICGFLFPSINVSAGTTYDSETKPIFDYLPASSKTIADGDHVYTITDNGTLLTVLGRITLQDQFISMPSNVSATGNEAYAFEIINNGSLIFNNGNISTSNSSRTINIDSGGSAEINDATISIGKDNGSAIYISGKNSFSGTNLVIESNAANITGLNLSNNATSQINNLTINLSNALNALNVDNSTLTVNGLTISGQNSTSPNQTILHAQGNNSANLSIVNINTADVTMNAQSGNKMIDASDYSRVSLDGGFYTLNGNNAIGFYVSDKDANLTAQNLTLTAHGENSTAVAAYGEMSLNKTTIETTGDNSTALYVDSSKALGNTVLTVKNANINASGLNSTAVVVTHSGVLDISDSQINTTGDQAVMFNTTDNSSVTAQNVIGNTTGHSAHLISSDLTNNTSAGNSNITLTNSQLTASGEDSKGIFTSFNPGGITHVKLDHSSLTSQSDVIHANGANIEIDLVNGSTLNSANNVLVNATKYMYIGDNTVTNSNVKLTADNSSLTGDVLAEADNQVDLYLNNNTFWTGGSDNAGNINIDTSSTWTVTRDSDANNLYSNGMTKFAHNNDNYSTLTINGNASGTGTFSINTWLGDDNSPTDKVVITGNLEGHHSLIVNNTGGPGELTSGNGINVVSVDGSSASDSLKLNGRVVQGALEYLLYQGGTTDANDWYLRSCYDCPVATDPTDDSGTTDGSGSGSTDGSGSGTTDGSGTGSADGSGSGTTDGSGSGSTDGSGSGTTDGSGSGSTGKSGGNNISWRSEIAGYIAAPQLNMRYGFDTLGTYHQRTGGDVLHKDGAWGRTVGQHNDYDGGRFSYDTDTWFVQFGTDVYYNKDEQNTEHTGGVTFAMGTQSTDVSDDARKQYRSLSVETGSINSDIYSFGGYYTVKAEDGGYIDTVGMANWYRNNYDSLSDAKQDGYGLALSVEVGKPFTLTEHVKIEPQGQVKYQYLHLDGFHDEISSVSGVASNNGEVRAGIRLFTDSNPDITPYLTLDALSVIGNEPTVQISDQRLQSDIGNSWWQSGAGISINIGGHTSVYSEIHYQKGFDSDSDGYSGGLGIKAHF